MFGDYDGFLAPDALGGDGGGGVTGPSTPQRQRKAVGRLSQPLHRLKRDNVDVQLSYGFGGRRPSGGKHPQLAALRRQQEEAARRGSFLRKNPMGSTPAVTTGQGSQILQSISIAALRARMTTGERQGDGKEGEVGGGEGGFGGEEGDDVEIKSSDLGDTGNNEHSQERGGERERERESKGGVEGGNRSSSRAAGSRPTSPSDVNKERMRVTQAEAERRGRQEEEKTRANRHWRSVNDLLQLARKHNKVKGGGKVKSGRPHWGGGHHDASQRQNVRSKSAERGRPRRRPGDESADRRYVY